MNETGRSVPAEVWRVASYSPLIARLIGKLEHPMREEVERCHLPKQSFRSPLDAFRCGPRST